MTDLQMNRVTATGWYLEHRAGTHFKFYTVIQTPDVLITHWGRIGTKGQVKLDTSQTSISSARKIVTNKLNKGYEVRQDAVEFPVYDEDVEGTLIRNDPRRMVTLFDAALRDPKFTGERDNLVDGYDHLLKKCQTMMDRAATQPFESVFNDFEELKAAWKVIEDKHSLAKTTMETTEQMLAQALLQGSF